LSTEEIENKARNLVSAYPEDLELIQFAAFMCTGNAKKQMAENTSAELSMYMLLSSLNLCQTFPNVFIALHIYLCMMVSNASGERSFLKLG